MSDETTLLSCPICGGNMREPITKRWTNCLGDISYSAWIKCWNCKLTLETDSCGYETEEAAENAVITAWNTRATHGTLTAEQVREAIEKRFDFDVWVPAERWQAIADELNAELGSGTITAEQVSMYLKAMAYDLQTPNPFKSLEEKQAIVEKYAHEIAELGSGTCETEARS